MDFQLDDGIAILERTPATFRALLGGLAKQYREAIGPWRAYLPVMDRKAGGSRD